MHSEVSRKSVRDTVLNNERLRFVYFRQIKWRFLKRRRFLPVTLMSVVLLSICSGWVHSIDGQHWWRARVEQAALTLNGADVVCRACWQTVHDLIKVLVSIFGQQRIECSVWELATAPIPRIKPINIGIFMFGISNFESILIFVNSTWLLWSLGEHLSCHRGSRVTSPCGTPVKMNETYIIF